MKNWVRYLDYFFITRPILFFPGWATLLAGYEAGAGNSRLFSRIMEGQFTFQGFHAPLLLGLLAFCLAMGGSFILNQLCDVESDRDNDKLFLIGEKHVTEYHGYIESLLLLTGGIILGMFLNTSVAVFLMIFILITGYAYNYPPLVLKNRPLPGLVANMAMGWIAFMIGWLMIRPLEAAAVIQSLPYLFFNTALYFLTTVPDIKGDAASNKITFAVRFGLKTTVRLSIIGFILAAAFSIILGDQFLEGVMLLTMPFLGRLVKQQSMATAVVMVKMGIFLFCLGMSIKFPVFFLMGVFLFYFTRFYYKRRFNFDYPNFKGV